MRRVVAVLGAVLMVGVAVLARGVLDDGDDDGADRRGGGGSDGEVTLLCIDELEAACAALAAAGAIDDFELESAGETVDRMADGELGADGWLALDPIPGIADVAREQAGRPAIFADAVATGFSTEISIVAPGAREAAVVGACRSEVSWPCLGDLVGDRWDEHGGESSWGEIKVGIDSEDSATGLLVAAQAVTAHLGLERFATNDLDNSDADRWLGRFDRGDGVLATLVTQGAAAFGAVGALDVEARAFAQTARGEDLGIFYPAPMFRAEVLLVAPGESVDGLVDADALAEALSAAGWEDEGGTELPSPGAMFALRELL